MTRGYRDDSSYWERKLAVYLHDPPDKALRIPGHEDRSKALLETLELSRADKDVYSASDQIAAGMDRSQLPGYHKDPAQSGAVDFIQDPCLTHPVGKVGPLRVVLPDQLDVGRIHADICKIIQEDCFGADGNGGGIASAFPQDPAGFAAARFHYIHHALRFRLSAQNVGGLGALWHRLPADTRMPDHSIWQHCALVSALASCFDLAPKRQAAIMVFAFSPVQDFISRARKLRDHWSASLLLSWLAFEGLRQVTHDLGSDHVLYPSLVDQPLIKWTLHRECGLDRIGSLGDEWAKVLTGAASLPNKFVCLVPCGGEAEQANRIQEAMEGCWQDLGRRVLNRVEQVVGRGDPELKSIFQRQVDNCFRFHWAAAPLFDDHQKTRGHIQEILAPSVWQRVFKFVDDSRKLPYPMGGRSAFYSLSHAAVQAFLAAGKSRKNPPPSGEQGIKCALHGDLEIARFGWQDGGDKNPRPANDPLWSLLRRHWPGAAVDFKETERLSAIGLIKRTVGRVMAQDADHPLGAMFAGSTTFPSTTEIALSDWMDQLPADARADLAGKLDANWRGRLADVYHESEEAGQSDATDRDAAARLKDLRRRYPIGEDDKYYAVLMMDGDRMGRLVSGENLGACWQDVVHPRVRERLERSAQNDPFQRFWQKHLPAQRLISPATHAALSEALSDFALHTVPRLIAGAHGRLVYAGGDDVCAVLPLSGALPAAYRIARAYNLGFVQAQGHPEQGLTEWTPGRQRLFLHLGVGDGISISAGLLVVHHKRPLTLALKRAHGLLDMAKNQGGRNAVALEIDRRSGGPRRLTVNWNELPCQQLGLEESVARVPLVEHFINLARQLGRREFGLLSTSLIYRLEQLRPGLQSIADQEPRELRYFLTTLLKRSGSGQVSEAEQALVAQHMAALLLPGGTGNNRSIDTVPLIMARFLARRMALHTIHEETADVLR